MSQSITEQIRAKSAALRTLAGKSKSDRELREITFGQAPYRAKFRLYADTSTCRWYNERHFYFTSSGVLESPIMRGVEGFLELPEGTSDPMFKLSQKHWAKWRIANKSGDLEAREQAKVKAVALSPQPRYDMLALEIAAPEKGIRKMSVSKALYTLIRANVEGDESQAIEPLEGEIFGQFGRDLEIAKVQPKGKSFASFDQSKFLAQKEYGTAQQWEAWEASAPSLESFRHPATTEQLNEALELITSYWDISEAMTSPQSKPSPDGTPMGMDDFHSKIRAFDEFGDGN